MHKELPGQDSLQPCLGPVSSSGPVTTEKEMGVQCLLGQTWVRAVQYPCDPGFWVVMKREIIEAKPYNILGEDNHKPKAKVLN